MKTQEMITKRIKFIEQQIKNLEKKSADPKSTDRTKYMLGIEAGVLDSQVSILKWVMED